MENILGVFLAPVPGAKGDIMIMKELKKFYNAETGLYEFGYCYTDEDISKMTQNQINALVGGGWVVLEGEKCSCWECKYQKNDICTRRNGGYGEGATCGVGKFLI